MIRKVLILGNHIQALGLARQIYQCGCEVILYTDSLYSITRYSKAVKQCFIFEDEADLMGKILKNAGDIKESLLFPTNDKLVAFLSSNYQTLSQKFFIGIPEPAIVNIFANKRNTYKFAEENNIPIPESHFPDSLESLEAISWNLQYPLIIKPAVMYEFHQIFGKKAYKCNNRCELMEKATLISERIPVDQLIIQEFLDGGAKSLYSYGTFCVDGKTVASLMANRIRQNPMDFGNSTTYAVTCNIPEIELQAEKILKLVSYFGLAEVEFMYDQKTDQYKFLEINTRAWKWHSISNGLGFSFIGKMLNYFNFNDTSEIKNFDLHIAWIERLTDTSVILKELLKGNNIMNEVLKSFRTKKVSAVWSSRDILPSIMYLLLSPILFFKRH